MSFKFHHSMMEPYAILPKILFIEPFKDLSLESKILYSWIRENGFWFITINHIDISSKFCINEESIRAAFHELQQMKLIAFTFHKNYHHVFILNFND